MEQAVEKGEQQSCTLCGGLFEKLNDSEEHIIPNAIGGKRKVKGFLCRQCNNNTGREWDAALARQLNPITNLLNIKRDRGTPPDLEVETATGRSLLHKSDGHITTVRYDESTQQAEGKIIVDVSAPNMRMLKRHLDGLVRQYPQLKGIDLLQHAEQKKEYIADPMGITLAFDVLDASRSVVKSCAALAHAAGVRLADLQYARGYLAGEDKPCLGYYNEKDVVLKRPPKTFFHCVHVQGDRKTGKVIGYVEYFGCYRIVVLLSDSYSGEAFSECYAIDPVAGKEIPLKVEFPDFTSEEIQEICEFKKVSIEATRSALATLIESYQEESLKREISRVSTDAVQYAFTNCGATPGERMTEEQINRFNALLMERLSPFLLHQFVNPEFPVDEPDA